MQAGLPCGMPHISYDTGLSHDYSLAWLSNHVWLTGRVSANPCLLAIRARLSFMSTFPTVHPTSDRFRLCYGISHARNENIVHPICLNNPIMCMTDGIMLWNVTCADNRFTYILGGHPILIQHRVDGTVLCGKRFIVVVAIDRIPAIN